MFGVNKYNFDANTNTVAGRSETGKRAYYSCYTRQTDAKYNFNHISSLSIFRKMIIGKKRLSSVDYWL